MTPLTKPLKRELAIRDRVYVVTLSPDSIKVTPKGKRKGLELRWDELMSGEAALATALNASLGALSAPAQTSATTTAGKRPKAARRAATSRQSR